MKSGWPRIGRNLEMEWGSPRHLQISLQAMLVSLKSRLCLSSGGIVVHLTWSRADRENGLDICDSSVIFEYREVCKNPVQSNPKKAR